MDNFLSHEIDVLDLMPHTVIELLEFQEIAKVENHNFNKLRLQISELFNYRFVMHATSEGIARWEKVLKIKSRPSDDLETRRKRVLAKINNRIPYTWRSLRQLLDSIFGEDNYHLDLDPHELVIELLIPNKQNYYNELHNILEPMIPLNILMIIAEGILKEIIRITPSTYAWGINKRITGRFKTSSRPATISAERLVQKENIYASPMHGRVTGRFRAGGAI